MSVEIRTTPISLELYGFEGTAVNDDYASAGFALMNRMWKTVKENKLQNDGQNVWLYEPGNKVFSGVGLLQELPEGIVLEKKTVTICKYAYYKHIGPYHNIRQSMDLIFATLKEQGLEKHLPYLEIYGHWTPDESKLETELIISVK